MRIPLPEGGSLVMTGNEWGGCVWRGQASQPGKGGIPGMYCFQTLWAVSKLGGNDDLVRHCLPQGRKSLHSQISAMATPWLCSIFQWAGSLALYGANLDLGACVKVVFCRQAVDLPNECDIPVDLLWTSIPKLLLYSLVSQAVPGGQAPCPLMVVVGASWGKLFFSHWAGHYDTKTILPFRETPVWGGSVWPVLTWRASSVLWKGWSRKAFLVVKIQMDISLLTSQATQTPPNLLGWAEKKARDLPHLY